MFGEPSVDLTPYIQGDDQGATGAVNTEPKGVVIEEVGEGSALEKAGLRPGDVVWAWERLATANREADRGKIESVFDWMWLKVEQAPRGKVILLGEQVGVERPFAVPIGEWVGKVRPRLQGRVLEGYQKGREKIEAGEIEQGFELWRQLTQAEEVKSASPLCRWIHLRIGEVYAEERHWKHALEAYLVALETVETPAAKVVIHSRIGSAYKRRSMFDQAGSSYRAALEIADATFGRSLHSARIKNNLGIVAWYQGRLELASSHYEDALEIKEKLAPESLNLAGSLNNLGVVAGARGQLELASACFQRALEIKEKLAPDTLDLARSLNNLGLVARARGQLELASGYHERALEIREKLAPDTLEVAMSLHNLGVVASVRGKVDMSSTYYQRALEIREKLAPESLDLVSCRKGVPQRKRVRVGRTWRPVGGHPYEKE